MASSGHVLSLDVVYGLTRCSGWDQHWGALSGGLVASGVSETLIYEAGYYNSGKFLYHGGDHFSLRLGDHMQRAERHHSCCKVIHAQCEFACIWLNTVAGRYHYIVFWQKLGQIQLHCCIYCICPLHHKCVSLKWMQRLHFFNSILPSGANIYLCQGTIVSFCAFVFQIKKKCGKSKKAHGTRSRIVVWCRVGSKAPPIVILNTIWGARHSKWP